MRPLELALLAAAIAFISICWRSGSKHWLRASALLLLVIVGLHLWLEGWRWQAVPLYSVVLLATWQIRKVQPVGWGMLIPALLLAVSGALLLWALPVIQTSTLSGPYTVGVSHVLWADDARSETRGGATEFRELMLSIWYPAENDSNTSKTAYLPDFEALAPDYAAKLGWPVLMVDYLKYGKGSARVDAPALPQKFPLILYSHGLNRNRFEAVTRMEKLASNGFVVVAVDHPYGADFVRFPDGRIERFVNTRNWEDTLAKIDRKRLERLNIWVADLAFVLDRIQAETSYPWYAADMKSVAAVGFSNGGSAALLLAHRDQRIGAVVDLDGTPRGEVVTGKLAQPALMMLSDPPQASNTELAQWGISREQFLAPMQQLQQRMQNIASQASAPVYRLRIAGTQHANFTDGPMLSPLSSWLGIGGTIDSKLAAEIVDAYLLAFLEQTLLEHGSPLLDSTDRVAPYAEVEWL